jgi:hypothetical protein
MNSRNSNKHGEAGLTLLEVLAAAMIFAMVMTVLIGTSSTAVHNVGMSARRLEANLVADSLLADLEIQMKEGLAPEIEEGEFEHEHFSVRMLKTDFVSDEGTNPAGTLADPGDAQIRISSMLGPGLPEVAKHMKQYDIEVGWIEQDGPQSVNRTTFAFDWQMAAIEYSDLFALAGSKIGNGIQGDGEDGAVPPRPGPGATLEEKREYFEAISGRRGGVGHNARDDALGINQDIWGSGQRAE